MEKKYIVKDFYNQTYYCGTDFEDHWWQEERLAHYFDTIEEAESFISRQDGKFQIEAVYHI